ncbi:DUF3489 domain-containing protein [Methylocystis sp. H62]|uniref:DUF3489 domain-containing protein n=1 Tax=Methylocystis sp. H62 TaxID=2785789 RepID=UPI0018C2D5E8|nr:DUF3489 domain-containing protein [Methylocystis sp. H62]MBG0793189.1 DUF3489 domain-containing protein [Methylocystis sp. H62]
MHKLTDGQRVVLSRAAQRDDGTANPAEILKSAAATKVVKSLIARKLMREVRAKADMPVWRRDAQGRPFSLVILSAGRKAIGVVDQVVESATREHVRASSNAGSPSRRSERNGRKGLPTPPDFEQPHAPVVSAAHRVRAGTKKALLIEQLSGSAGASIDALMGATGWLPHTTRAALSGLRHAGFSIERFRRDDGVSAYRLHGGPVSLKSVNPISDRHNVATARA